MKFEYEFRDEGPRRISFEYASDAREQLKSARDGDACVLYVNKAACCFLAKAFAKLALGSHAPGFHFHLTEDLNAEKAEALRIVLLGT